MPAPLERVEARGSAEACDDLWRGNTIPQSLWVRFGMTAFAQI
jgi:hypothetical protein